MKTLIIAVAFCFLANYSFSQARIGHTEQQIRNEWSDQKFSSGRTEDGTKWIEWEEPNMRTFYYFGKDGLCNFCIAKPLNQATLNTMVQHYNNTAVIISDIEWKLYTDNGILNIKLLYSDNGSYFTFRRAE